MLPCNSVLGALYVPTAGVEQIYGLGTLSDYETAGLKAMMPELRASIEKGIAFAKES